MQLQQMREGENLIVILNEKRLDAVVAVAFREEMARLVDEGNKQIVFDMSHVNFIDSSGLGALVSVLKYLGDKGRLHICCVSAGVMPVLKLTRMDRVLKLFESRSEALNIEISTTSQ